MNSSTEEFDFESNQRYFLKKLSAYFVDKSSLKNKRTESIRSLIDEVLTTTEEIKSANSDMEITRLSKALEYQIKEINHVFKTNELYRMRFKRDTEEFNKLIKQIQFEGNKDNNQQKKNFVFSIEFNKFLRSLSSFRKVLGHRILVKEHFNCILKSKLAYEKIDILLDSLMNELLYIHSSKHIEEELSRLEKKKGKKNLEDTINLYSNVLSNEEINNNHTFIFRIKLSDAIQVKNFENILLELNSDFIFDYNRLVEEYSDVIDLTNLASKKNVYVYTKIQVEDSDIYKASRQALNKVKSLLCTYQLLNLDYNFDFTPKGLYRAKDEKWVIRDVIFEDVLPNEGLSDRTKNDIDTFMKLRFKRFYNNDETNSTFLIERAYNLMYINKNSTPENSVLNNWLAMEHLVTPYMSNAIIERVRQIYPKVVSLYYIKGLMNEVWMNMNSYVYHSNNVVIEFITPCKSEIEDWKYNTIKFAESLKTLQINSPLMLAVEDEILLRKLKELNSLLKDDRKALLKKTKDLTEAIEYDLNRIYRIRNKIVHSGIVVSANLDLIGLRLEKYIECLLGTVIHYMNLNDSLEIEDILNSIVETYNWYVTEKQLDLKNTILPKYLYL